MGALEVGNVTQSLKTKPTLSIETCQVADGWATDYTHKGKHGVVNGGATGYTHTQKLTWCS